MGLSKCPHGAKITDFSIHVRTFDPHKVSNPRHTHNRMVDCLPSSYAMMELGHYGDALVSMLTSHQEVSTFCVVLCACEGFLHSPKTCGKGLCSCSVFVHR